MNLPAPDTGPDFDLRAYLLGSWSVERTLLDRAAGTRGSFSGVVQFTGNDGGGLRLREDGTVSWTSYTAEPFTGPASREYLLRPGDTPAVMDVFFPDGRPFHRMGFTAQSSKDRHWCDPDSYRVGYELIGPDDFRYRWDVTGPAKDQLLESVLHRLGDLPPRQQMPGPRE